MSFIPPISQLTSGLTGASGLGSGFNSTSLFPLAGSSELSTATDATDATGAAGGSTFGQLLSGKISELNALHNTSDQLAVAAVTGDLTDIHQYTIAANEAAVATQLTVAVRNKAVDAFTEIMRMTM